MKLILSIAVLAVSFTLNANGDNSNVVGVKANPTFTSKPKDASKSVDSTKRTYHLIPDFKDLKKLEVKKIAAVISALRQFSLEQEERKIASSFGFQERWRDVATLLLPKSAFAQDSGGAQIFNGCKYSESEIQKLGDRAAVAKSDMNKCMIAGHLVCLKASNSQLLCSQEKIPTGGCEAGLKPCGYPLFMFNQDGKAKNSICMPPSRGSFTQSCINAQNSATPEQIAKTILENDSDSEIAKEWTIMKASLELYCGVGILDPKEGRKNFKGHYFDFKDCQDLAKRIAAIDKLLNRDRPVCDYLINDKDLGIEKTLQVKLWQQDDGRYKIQKYGSEAKNWFFAECGDGFPESPHESATSNAVWQPCLTKKDNPKNGPYKAFILYSWCSTYHGVVSKAELKDGKCEVPILEKKTVFDGKKATFYEGANEVYKENSDRSGDEEFRYESGDWKHVLKVAGGTCYGLLERFVSNESIVQKGIKMPAAQPATPK